MKIGVKYCGGCNPRYDRGAFVEGLKARYPDAEFQSARPQERYDQVLVVCGCAARCADVSAIRGDQIRYICGGGPFQL